MICHKCGKENTAVVEFCGGCGSSLTPRTAPAAAPEVPAAKMTFGLAIKTCLSKYADYHGRAGRPEFWWFYLFQVLLNMVAMLMDRSGVVAGLVFLALMAPNWAVSVRRLHDMDRSGWWYLLPIPIMLGGVLLAGVAAVTVGKGAAVLVALGAVLASTLALMVLLAKRGDDGTNRFGPPA